ncbi:hypothetical protein Barb4_02199 [Bacteroidales bacterium Barb4]|nr:hypothetical protein Barb4_02199 [Bacteroidales bacterium Barb4]
MPLRTDDSQTAGSLHFGSQLDVGTAPCHVRGNGHRTLLSGLGDNIGFPLMQFRIQHVVRYVAHVQHTAQQFGYFHRCCTDQHRPSCRHQRTDFINDGTVFLPLRLIDAVVHILAGNGAVGRDYDHVQLVDVPKFAGFRLRRTGHAGQLVIHAEIVLQGNRGKGLRSRFHLHPLLRLDGLMQTVRIAATLHDAPRLFVHNHHLVVHHHIFIILLKQSIGFQQLVDGMHPLALHRIVGKKLVLLDLLFLCILYQLQLRQLGGYVGQDEELRVVRLARQHVNPLVGQLNRIVLFVYHKVKLIRHQVHIAHVIRHIRIFRFQHLRLDTRLAQILNQRLVAGIPLVGTVKLERAFLCRLRIIAAHLLPRFDKQLGSQILLGSHHNLHIRAELLEQLFLPASHRPRYN